MNRVPGTPFAADYWGAQDGLRFYFLSHMHAGEILFSFFFCFVFLNFGFGAFL